MRKLDLNQPATDHCIIGYVDVRDAGRMGLVSSIPVYETVADPHIDTVKMTGAQADKLTDQALIAELVAALKTQHDAIDGLLARLVDKVPGFFPTKSPAWSAVVMGQDVLRKARACGHG